MSYHDEAALRDTCQSASWFLDTALAAITEYELHLEGVAERPVPMVPSPWFDGAKALCTELRHVTGELP